MTWLRNIALIGGGFYIGKQLNHEWIGLLAGLFAANTLYRYDQDIEHHAQRRIDNEHHLNPVNTKEDPRSVKPVSTRPVSIPISTIGKPSHQYDYQKPLQVNHQANPNQTNPNQANVNHPFVMPVHIKPFVDNQTWKQNRYVTFGGMGHRFGRYPPIVAF